MTRRRRLRRRGHYLLTFGFVQLLLGLLSLDDPSRADGPARQLFSELLHPPVYLSASAFVFALCVAAVICRVPVFERWAFTGLAALAAVRAGLLLVAAYAADGPVSTGLLSQAALFLLVLRVHVLIAGWPEPQKVLVLDEDDWRSIAAELRRRLNGES